MTFGCQTIKVYGFVALFMWSLCLSLSICLTYMSDRCLYLPDICSVIIAGYNIAAFAASEGQANPMIVELEKTAEGMGLTSWVARSKNVQSASHT